MRIEFIPPRQELAPYITKIWLLESDGLILSAQNSLIVPNGRTKLMIPYRGHLYTTDHHKTAVCKEGDICLIGIRDVPVTLGSSAGAAGSIGIEFTTAGTNKFSRLPMHELSNNLFSLGDLFGSKARHLLERINALPKPLDKVAAMQQFLVEQLRNEGRHNPIMDYTIETIIRHHGLIEVNELERRTGYTRRYLNLLFKDHLGVSPKTLAMLIRFQRFYKDAHHWQELYYDQSHFIRAFKQHTGLTPGQFLHLPNDFGKRF